MLRRNFFKTAAAIAAYWLTGQETGSFVGQSANKNKEITTITGQDTDETTTTDLIGRRHYIFGELIGAPGESGYGVMSVLNRKDGSICSRGESNEIRIIRIPKSEYNIKAGSKVCAEWIERKNMYYICAFPSL